MDRLRCPIHVAAETGQLAIFRTFVHVDTCSIFASDGQGLKPLNISLRKKQKAITSFLLTKQWTSVTYGSSKQTIPLYLYSKMKKWGDRARDRTIIKHGMTKSSMKVILSLESNFKNIQTLKQQVLPENTRKIVLKLYFTTDANKIMNTVFCRLFVLDRNYLLIPLSVFIQ